MTKEIESVTSLKCENCGESYGIAMPTHFNKDKWGEFTPPIKQGFCNKCQKLIDNNFEIILVRSEEDKEPLAMSCIPNEEAWAMLYENSNAQELLKYGGMCVDIDAWKEMGLPISEELDKLL